jgi:hypothetical protein
MNIDINLLSKMLMFVGQVKGYFVAVEQEHHEFKSYFIENMLLIKNI